MNKQDSLNIRYFIYLNAPLLYSIYSQIFEGVKDSITQEKIIELITSNTEGEVHTTSRADDIGTKTTSYAERGILHDHMYSLLENELASSFPDLLSLSHENFSTILTNQSIIKVSGPAEIEDYKRIKVFFKEFNELVEAIAYTGKSSNAHKKAVLDLVVKIDEDPASAQRKKLQSELNKLRSATAKAVEMELLQDQELLDRFAKFTDAFSSDSYNVVITPASETVIHYRGALDKDWLRISPELISSLYGGQSADPWTMVGIVTHIQGTYAKHKDLTSSLQNDPENPMMLDSFRNMFRQARAFERMFLESLAEVEIVISPLAIYREVKIRL